MIQAAQEKFSFDPRIHVLQEDYLEHETPGYDVLMAFNSYQHFLQPNLFLQKARELLRPHGRLTVAFPFDRERMNILSAILPAGLARGLLPADEEIVFWSELFHVDCVCDNESFYMISGEAKQKGDRCNDRKRTMGSGGSGLSGGVSSGPERL